MRHIFQGICNPIKSFGSVMQTRNWSAFSYRYGFNGQEKDDEVSGKGNAYSFEYRIHDPRLGRFLSVDPLTKKYPFYTPYQFAGNTPIEAKELEGLEPSHTAQKSDCENCSEATLEDGDYFSDVQTQKYTTTFSGVSSLQFDLLKSQLSLDPGSVINNDRAEYRLVDRDGSYGVTKDDHFDIEITGGPNGFVVVQSVIMLENSIIIQVQTLEGHPDAGTNIFSATYNPDTKELTWQTTNTSRTNDNLTGGTGAGFMDARGKQQLQWKDVALKVHSFLAFPTVKSATAEVKEFDYNDYTNKIGAEEIDESFTEDFISSFPKR